jgi:HSP20 family protein
MTNLMLRDPLTLLPTVSGQMRKLSPYLKAVSRVLNGPAVTVYETADEYCFLAEVPGWTRDQVKIDFENQTQTVSGQRDLEVEGGRQYHRVEGFYGQFTRSFTVPGLVDPALVQAELKDGILTIHLPKREDAKPRQIEVRTVQ